MVPSPQLMLAVKSVLSGAGLASVKVASVAWFTKPLSPGLRSAPLVAVRAALVTSNVPCFVSEFPPSVSLTVISVGKPVPSSDSLQARTSKVELVAELGADAL